MSLDNDAPYPGDVEIIKVTVSCCKMGDVLAHNAFALRVLPLIHADIQKVQEEYDDLEKQKVNGLVSVITSEQITEIRDIDTGVDKQYCPISSDEKITRKEIEKHEERNQEAIAAKKQSEISLPEPQAADDQQKTEREKEIERLRNENIRLQVVDKLLQRITGRNMLFTATVDEKGKLHVVVTRGDSSENSENPQENPMNPDDNKSPTINFFNISGDYINGDKIINEIRNDKDVDKNAFDEKKEKELRDAIMESIENGKLSSTVGTVLGSIAHVKTKSAIEAIINKFFPQK